jgi:hypothetical protein
MYCSTSLEANWYEERFQNASGSNVGARIEGRAHHEEPPTKVTRERDASLSAPLAGGLDVLTCIAREPLPSSDRTMHTPGKPFKQSYLSRQPSLEEQQN